jgi:hypothetical protein
MQHSSSWESNNFSSSQITPQVLLEYFVSVIKSPPSAWWQVVCFIQQATWKAILCRLSEPASLEQDTGNCSVRHTINLKQRFSWNLLTGSGNETCEKPVLSSKTATNTAVKLLWCWLAETLLLAHKKRACLYACLHWRTYFRIKFYIEKYREW